MTAYPPDLTTVTIKFGPYLDVAGNIATRQTFIISPPAPVIHTPTGTVLIPTRVKVETGADGTAEVVVPATDDPSITPQDFTYRVEPPAWVGEPMNVPAPGSVPVIDFDLLQSFPPSDGVPVPSVWPWESAQVAEGAALEASADAAAAALSAAAAHGSEEAAGADALDAAASATAAQTAEAAAASSAAAAGLSETAAAESQVAAEGSEIAAAGSATTSDTARIASEAAAALALAGQFAGATLATGIDLNTLTTPGVYFFTSAILTSGANFPVGSGGGTVEVLRYATTGTSVIQRLTIATGTHGGRAIFIRRWSTSWGAWAQIPTARIDQTAGRAIYIWDPLNAREQLIYGDTGWRELTLENGWAGSVRARRVGSTVDVFCTALVAGSSTLITPLGSGFRPQQNIPIMARPANIANPPFYGQVTWQTGYLSLPTAQLYGNQSSQFSFTTLDPWPTTLPGTAVGSIPA